MTIQLPEDAEERAESFSRLSTTTKKQLIDTLKYKPAEDQTKILNSVLMQSGVASDFYHHLLSKESDPRVPNNKRLNPIHTK